MNQFQSLHKFTSLLTWVHFVVSASQEDAAAVFEAQSAAVRMLSASLPPAKLLHLSKAMFNVAGANTATDPMLVTLRQALIVMLQVCAFPHLIHTRARLSYISCRFCIVKGFV